MTKAVRPEEIGVRAARVPERAWQDTIVALLEQLGYACCHTFPLRTKHGWRTGTTAKGWPDLVALRGLTIVAIECKSDTGKVEPEQIEWLERFAALGCGHAWVLTPSADLQTIAEFLQHPSEAPERIGF